MRLNQIINQQFLHKKQQQLFCLLLLLFAVFFSSTNLIGQASCVAPLSVTKNPSPPSNGLNGGNFTINASDIDDNSTGTVVGISFNSNSFSGTSVTANCSAYPTNEVEVWLFVDNGGQQTNCSTTVALVDNSAPFIACMPSVQIPLDPISGEVTVTTGMVAQVYENCSVSSFIISGGNPTYNCSNTGTQSVTLIATDMTGNSSSQSCSFDIVDSTLPVANCQQNISYFTSNQNGITASDVDDGSSDNCSFASMSVTPNIFSCADVGSNITVTLTVTDNAGNSDNCTCSVSVFDDSAPTLSLFNFASVSLDMTGSQTIMPANVTNSSSTSDDCTSYADLTWTFDPPTVDCDDIGSPVSIAVTVTDESNNSTTGSVNVSVFDSQEPVAMCQTGPIQLPLDANGSAQLTPMMVDDGSTDNCPSNMFMSLSQTMFNCSHVGQTNQVTLTVTDGVGNTATSTGMCTADVIVVDDIAPTVTCKDHTIDYGTSITPGDITDIIFDNCGISSQSISQSSFDCTDLGANTVTLTVTDASGNSTVCSSTVTVEDNTDPTAVAQNIVAQLDANGIAVVNPFAANNGSSDDCDNSLNFSVSPPSFGCDDLGGNMATLIVTDDSGNSASTNFTVIVRDTITPTLATQSHTATIDATGMVTVEAKEFVAMADDNCSIRDTMISLTEMGGYATELDFDCIDAINSPIDIWVRVRHISTNGNPNRAVRISTTLTLEAASMPVALAKDITLELDQNGEASITHLDVDDGSSGLCGVAVTLSKFDFDCDDIGTETITLTATDAFGNSSTTTSMVTIEDNEYPVLSVNPFNAFLDASGSYSLDIADMASYTDNCDDGSLVADMTTFSCVDAGSHLITFTATDGSGNSQVASANLNLSDNTAPIFTCKNEITVDLDPMTGMASILNLDDGDIFDVLPTDNCTAEANISITFSKVDYDCNDIYSPTVFTSNLNKFSSTNLNTITVSDMAGNSATCTADILVENPPLAIAKDAGMIPIQMLDATGSYTLDPHLIDNGSIAACESGTLSVTPSSFDCSNLGANTVTLRYELPDGDFHEATTTITLEVDPLFPDPCNPCPDVVNINNDPIFNGTYTSGNIINSNGHVSGASNSNNIIFQAENEINLEAGFEANSAANLLIETKQCVD